VPSFGQPSNLKWRVRQFVKITEKEKEIFNQKSIITWAIDVSRHTAHRKSRPLPLACISDYKIRSTFSKSY